MIETLGTYTPLAAPPEKVEGWLREHADLWRTSVSAKTGNYSGTLHGDATRLGRVKIQRDFAGRDGTGNPGYVAIAEGNLLTLLHGPRGKHLTMRSPHVKDAATVYGLALTAACPLIAEDPEQTFVSRTDTSVTWQRDNDVAAYMLAQATASLSLANSGRRVFASYGTSGATSRDTKKRTVRVYNKTAEMLAHAKNGQAPAPDLGPGIHVRLEVQERGKKARATWGTTLGQLGKGYDMARPVVKTVTDRFMEDLVPTLSPADLMHRLMSAGASGVEALRLIGPAQMLVAGGIPGLLQLGVSEPSAYRVRARLRDLLQVPRTPEETQGDQVLQWSPELVFPRLRLEGLWDVDEAAYAGEDI